MTRSLGLGDRTTAPSVRGKETLANFVFARHTQGSKEHFLSHVDKRRGAPSFCAPEDGASYSQFLHSFFLTKRDFFGNISSRTTQVAGLLNS